MEAKSLMIGDWIQVITGYDFELENKPMFHQVALISYSRHIIGCNGTGVLGEDFFVSIPLTPEILEKNGFVLRGKTYILKWRGAEIHWRKTDGYASITAPNNLKLEGWCSISNGYFCYVHILQHALRLCGLDELADNFKV